MEGDFTTRNWLHVFTERAMHIHNNDCVLQYDAVQGLKADEHLLSQISRRRSAARSDYWKIPFLGWREFGNYQITPNANYATSMLLQLTSALIKAP